MRTFEAEAQDLLGAMREMATAVGVGNARSGPRDDLRASDVRQSRAATAGERSRPSHRRHLDLDSAGCRDVAHFVQEVASQRLSDTPGSCFLGVTPGQAVRPQISA
jgi:hypothetical protein